MRFKIKRGFTLIELLVVIAVIALLMAVVIPALRKAKVHAQKVVCSSNIRQLSVGILLYADQNKDDVPINTKWNGQGSYWFWDVSYWMTDRLVEYGNFVPDVFFCPAVRDKNPDDVRWWQYSQTPSSFSEVNYYQDESGLSRGEKMAHYRTTTNIFLIDLVEMNPAASNYGESYRNSAVGDTNFQWIRKLTRVKNSSTREMVMDSIISGMSTELGGDAFNAIAGGGVVKYGITDSTCHLTQRTYNASVSCLQNKGIRKGRIPDGGNIGFVDGHVDWRPFEEMSLQINGGTDFYW